MFAVHLHEIRFLSTPSARRATPLPKFYHEKRLISIHALREEGDSCLFLPLHQNFNFYPRPPRGGRRYQVQLFRSHGLFLSTPSARRATFGLAAKESREPISIHALREEGDPRGKAAMTTNMRFLSTPSARRATCKGWRQPDRSGISIHALREEGDWTDPKAERHLSDFYPRPPRGGRRRCIQPSAGSAVFLSTPSARRATKRHPDCFLPWRNFYPRPPRGGRLVIMWDSADRVLFLSTPSARRATWKALK